MKKHVLFLLAALTCSAIFAQTEPSQPTDKNQQQEFKTVFGSGKHSCKIPLGYFVELNAAFTMVGSYNVFMPGISGGVILNHKWTIGLTGSLIGLPHGLKYDSIYYDTVGRPKKPAYLWGGYGGVLLEYTLFPKSAVHVSFPLMIGMGYMCYRNTDSYNHNHNTNNNNQNWNYDRSNHLIADTYCFVIEPGVRLEFNLVKMLRMGVTVSYRYAPGFSLTGLSSSELNQFNAKLSFRLGKF